MEDVAVRRFPIYFRLVKDPPPSIEHYEESNKRLNAVLAAGLAYVPDGSCPHVDNYQNPCDACFAESGRNVREAYAKLTAEKE